jgi:hypothetical protein
MLPPAPRRRPARAATALFAALVFTLSGLAFGGGPAGAATTVTTLTPVADSYVDSSTRSTNYGNNARIVADASPTREIYLRFDLTSIAGPLQQAKLRLHITNTSDAGSASGGNVARVDNDTWTESGITYNNRPTAWGPTTAAIGAVSRNTWVEATVTSAVTLGSTVTLGIRSTNSDGAYYDSRHTGSNAPQLVVVTGTPESSGGNAVAAACSGELIAANGGRLTDSKLKEISGIDNGSVNPNLYWVHNDSGDSARVFAVNPSGATQRVYNLSGASAVDWEDIGVGPGPQAGASYLYLADIGDNATSRSEIVVYRVLEPTVTPGSTTSLSGVGALRLRYPDGAHNAESFLVDPVTGELFIIEKTAQGGTARIYRAPANLAAGSLTTLTLVGSLALPSGATNLVTGADLSADGSQIAVRTYAAVLLWNRASGTSIAEALASAPCAGPVPPESKGEAVAFRSDGRGYVTVGEGTNQVMHTYTAP